MRQRNHSRTKLTVLSFIAFIFGTVFIAGHMREVSNIITQYVQYTEASYFNIDNIAYCLVGFMHVFLAVVLMYPHRDIELRKKCLKIVFYSVGILYLLGNIWIFRWLISNIASDTFSFDVSQLQREKAVMFSHLMWATRDAETIFYNYFMGILWISMGYYINRDRRFVCRLMLVNVLFLYMVPVLVYFIKNSVRIPDWWMKKTIPLLCTDVLIAVALFLTSLSREEWNRNICRLRGHHSRHHSGEGNEHSGEAGAENHGGHHHHHHHHHTETDVNSISETTSTEEQQNGVQTANNK